MADLLTPEPKGNTEAATGSTTPAETKPAEAGAGAPAVKPGEVTPPKTGDGVDYSAFKAPEGVQLEPETLGEFQAVAKGMGLSQEQAQSLVDLGAKLVQRNSLASDGMVKDMRAEWESQVKADKEIGGDNLSPNLEVAKQAMRNFGSPELNTFLEETGIGNNPALIKFMVKVGKAMGEDRTVDGAATGGAAGKSTSDVLYPGQ